MRKRNMRLALISAFAALAVSGVIAGGAKAAVTPIVFDGAAADIGPLLKGQNILCDDQTRAGATPCPPDKTMTISPDLTGAFPNFTFTIQPADFVFPTWKTKLDTTALNVDVALTSVATGTYNGSTGALAANPASFTTTVTAVGALPGPSDLVCSSTGNMWAFTTENGPPGQTPDTGELLGQRFSTPFPPSGGAVVALWDSINQFPDPIPMTMANECAQLNLAASGPGGIWLGKGLMRNFTRKAAPPATTPPATTPPAKSKKCKKGFKKKGKKCVKKKKKK